MNASVFFSKLLLKINAEKLVNYHVSTLIGIKCQQNLTGESLGLAGEPKHFPFAIVFVLIIKITLTCRRGFP